MASVGYLPIPASPSLNVGAGSGVTIEGWIKPNDPSQVAMPIVEWDSASSDGLQLWLGSRLKLFANLRDTAGNGHPFFTAMGLVSTNSLQHVALTYDKSSGAGLIYLNAVPVASTNFGSLTLQTSYGLNLGKRPFTGELYQGLLDEMSLYSRALSSNEIAAIYNAGNGGKCLPPPAPPVIATQPTNQTVVVGGTANFTVVAGGTLPLSYHWNFNGTNLSGATNTTLTLTNVQLNQAGNYAVVVTNLYGSVTSSNAVLTVNLPPPCTPAPSGLVSWWPGEGNGNDVVDGNDGMVLPGVAFVGGEVGQAFLLNNTNAYVNVPASPTLNVGTGRGFTLEAWIYPTNVSSHHPIFEWNQGFVGGNLGAHLWIDQASGALFANIVDTGGGSHYVTSAANIVVTNEFQHVALTYDRASGVAALYLNGSNVLQQTMGSFIPQTSYNFYIGKRPSDGPSDGTYGSFFGGIIDEPSVYSRALSSNEIAAIFNAGSEGKCVTPPKILRQPDGQSVLLGCNATFHVVARGTKPLSYQWWKDGLALDLQTNMSLVLTNVQTSDFGAYGVVVTNVSGAVTSSPALLGLGQPPVANADTIQRFSSGGIRVNAADLLANDTDADGDSLTIIEVSSNSAAGGTVSLTNNWIYYDPPVGFTNTDTFTYTVGDGHCGTDVGTVTVQVKTDDPKPFSFAIENQGDGSIRLTFAGIPGDTYRIQYADSLSNPSWQTLTTPIADNFGICQFVDWPLTNAPTRFYRAVWPWWAGER
jgi:hypothetical protein